MGAEPLHEIWAKADKAQNVSRPFSSINPYQSCAATCASSIHMSASTRQGGLRTLVSAPSRIQPEQPRGPLPSLLPGTESFNPSSLLLPAVGAIVSTAPPFSLSPVSEAAEPARSCGEAVALQRSWVVGQQQPEWAGRWAFESGEPGSADEGPGRIRCAGAAALQEPRPSSEAKPLDLDSQQQEQAPALLFRAGSWDAGCEWSKLCLDLPPAGDAAEAWASMDGLLPEVLNACP